MVYLWFGEDAESAAEVAYRAEEGGVVEALGAAGGAARVRAEVSAAGPVEEEMWERREDVKVKRK